MHAAIALGLIAFTLCFISTPLCRNLFLRLDIVDRPDDVRKLHGKPIPRVGGIAIAFSYALALILLLTVAPHGARLFIRHKTLLLSLLGPAALVFVTGLVDDLVGLRPRNKLAGLAVASSLAVALGARITLIGSHPIADWISIPLSIFWLLACSNALNLIDGLDGLAAGVGLFATLTTLLAAILQDNIGLVMATIPLAACLLAFLRYNFNPASVFLGDSGSLTIGFLLGLFGLIWSQKSATFLGMAAPMMALAVPLLDVCLSIGRRYLSRKPIFGADRGHIHHRLLALGFTPRGVALILYGVCGIAAAFSLLYNMLSYRFQGITVILFCGLVLLGVHRLKYAEFSVVREVISRRTFTRVLHERVYLDGLKRSMEQAQTLDACWRIVHATCNDLRFASVEMDFAGSFYAGILDTGTEEPSCIMTLSLGGRGKLNLTRSDDGHAPVLMMPALRTLQESFRVKQFTIPDATKDALQTENVRSVA